MVPPSAAVVGGGRAEACHSGRPSVRPSVSVGSDTVFNGGRLYTVSVAIGDSVVKVIGSKVKVICVQICECYNIPFNIVASTMTCSV